MDSGSNHRHDGGIYSILLILKVEDKEMITYVTCHTCGKLCSGEIKVLEKLVIRGYVECPECIEKSKKEIVGEKTKTMLRKGLRSLRLAQTALGKFRFGEAKELMIDSDRCLNQVATDIQMNGSPKDDDNDD